MILSSWLVADWSCVGVRRGTCFTTAKRNTEEQDRVSCNLLLYKTLLQFWFQGSCSQTALYYFPVFMKMTFLLPVKLLQVCWYKSTLLSKHPFYIVMCAQWWYAFIKEKISTLFSRCYHLMGCYRLHNPYLDFYLNGKFEWGLQVVNVFLAERADIMSANGAKMEKHFQRS